LQENKISFYILEIMFEKKKKSFTVDELKRKLENYCVYQDRCHKEVEQKMREYDLIPEARELILLSLLKDNFLNEERFSKSFARGKFRIKSWGKQRIVRELKFRDISAYNIKTALKEIDEQEYIKTIYRITENRNAVISESNFYKRKKKLIDFLMRKGFENDLIYKVVKEVVS
jgi:regulatory protein